MYMTPRLPLVECSFSTTLYQVGVRRNVPVVL
jgi:hypothetical protein